MVAVEAGRSRCSSLLCFALIFVRADADRIRGIGRRWRNSLGFQEKREGLESSSECRQRPIWVSILSNSELLSLKIYVYW